MRPGDGPEAAAEVDSGGVRADGGGAEAAVEVGIGRHGSHDELAPFANAIQTCAG